MAYMNPDTSNLQLLGAAAQGSGQFVYDLQPKTAAFKGSAKDLMLKDADYSTPSDHYFSHLQRMKEDQDYTSDEKKKEILAQLNVSE